MFKGKSLRVALISTPIGLGRDIRVLKSKNSVIDTISNLYYSAYSETIHNNYGVIPHLGLGYAAAILEKCGCEVKCFDIVAERLKPKELINILKQFNPGLLGVSVSTYPFHGIMSWIRYIKKCIDVPVLTGGVHMELYPKETFIAYPEVNYGIMGEAEETLPEFIRAFRKGQYFEDIKGLCFRKNGSIVINSARPLINDIDSCPFPARHLFPMDKYFSLVSYRKNFTPMVTSRGCPFKCIYCKEGNKNFRFHTPKYVVDEMEMCIKDFDIKEIDIYDSLFTFNKERVLDICKLIRKRNLKFAWEIRSRVDTVDKEMLKELRKAGCYRIHYGIESGVLEVLKTIRKGIGSIEQIKDTIKNTTDCGIETIGFFMLGCPGETEETINKTIIFSVSIGLDYAMYQSVRAYPGTELYSRILASQKKDYWREYILDGEKNSVFIRHGVNLTDKKLEGLVKKAFRKFYFRPGYIIRRLVKMRTFKQLWKHIKFAMDMFIKG